MKLCDFSCTLLCLVVYFSLSAQYNNSQISESINTDGSAPDASSILDIQSNTKGVLVPRMDSTDRKNIISPANGLLVYDNSTNTFWYHNGSWIELSTIGYFEQIGNLVRGIGTHSEDFVFGDDELPENPGSSYSGFLYDKNKHAFRAGFVQGDRWSESNRGQYSVAFGESNMAFGQRSAAFGDNTNAIGVNATAFGRGGEVYGENATAFGNNTVVDGDNAIAFGSSTTANGHNSAVFGSSSSADGNNATAFGTFSEADGENATAFGSSNDAIGLNSTAFGQFTEVLGENATGFGKSTDAVGINSASFGERSHSAGENAVAFGYWTKADAYSSFALGRYNVGGGDTIWQANDPLFEIGIGQSNNDRENAVTVLKNGNTGVGTATPEVELTTVGEVRAAHQESEENFVEIGHDGSRGYLNTDGTHHFDINHNDQTILTVATTQNVGIRTPSPGSDLHISHGSNAGNDGMRIENDAGNDNFFRLYVVNSTGHLRLYTDDTTSHVGYFDDASGSYFATSDRRKKADIKTLDFTWKQFDQLKPLTFIYKSDENQKERLGLIAQDTEGAFPQLVSYDRDSDAYHLDYAGIGVLAIKAMQKQRAEIQILIDKNYMLRNEVDDVRSSLMLKISELENKLESIMSQIQSQQE